MYSRPYFCEKLHLKPTEFFITVVSLVALAINCIILFYKDVSVHYMGYAGIGFVAAFNITVGLIYRINNRSERIASAMICTGLFIFFSAVISMYNYLMLPLTRPTIDIHITRLDAMLGYSWVDVMTFAAQYPTIVFIMKLAYMSTMFQFALLIVLLGLLGRTKELHMMITTVTITSTLTICFWGLFPSLGSTTLYNVTPEIWASVNPPVNREYALALIDIAKNGVAEISPFETRGLVALPSYHAVLSFIAIFAAWNIKYVREVFLIINLLILPSIFIHGGHHFLDLPAGFAMFLIGFWAARKSVNSDYKKYKLPEFIKAV